MPTKFWGLGIEHETNYFVGTTSVSGRNVLKLWHSDTFEDPDDERVAELHQQLNVLINPSHEYTCLVRWDAIESLSRIIALATGMNESKSESESKDGGNKKKVKGAEPDDAQLLPLVRKLQHAIAKGRFSKDELKKLVEIDFSNTGPYPEFVTSNFKRVTVGQCVRELVDKEGTFQKLTRFLYGQTLKQCRYGAWPFIFTSNLEDYDKKTATPKVDTAAPQPDKPQKLRLTEDYNGSYHINVTLPVQTNFFSGHLAAMKMLQWMEPLFVAVWGQPSVFSFADGNNGGGWRYTEGSQRMVNNRFSRMGTRSLVKAPGETARQLLRTMKQRSADPERPIKKPVKIPRYVDRKKAPPTTVPVYLPTVEYVMMAQPSGESYGADFRRGQKEPFGFEFRILDHFPPKYLPDILHILLLVCDQSAGADPDSIPDPQTNTDWNDLSKLVLMEGWNADVTTPQILAVTQALNLEVHEPVPRTAIGLFSVILDLLWQANGRGRGAYTRRMVEASQRVKKPRVVNLNKQAFDAYAHIFLAGKKSLARAQFEDEADVKALTAPAKGSVLM